MKNLLAVLCGVALLAGCVTTSKSNKPLVAMQDAPEFALENVQGGQIKSAQLKGKVLILDFWATWCPPCKAEIPNYNKLRAEYKDKGVELVGVTFDSGTLEKVKPSVAELNIQYPVAMATDEIDAALGGHIGYPTTFLIGKDWKVYRKISGVIPNKKELLERDIKELLEKPED
jgi:cytochrome c biogenesis protein CcmG/thiol:disulfide interchange protein DsbE